MLSHFQFLLALEIYAKTFKHTCQQRQNKYENNVHHKKHVFAFRLATCINFVFAIHLSLNVVVNSKYMLKQWQQQHPMEHVEWLSRVSSLQERKSRNVHRRLYKYTLPKIPRAIPSLCRLVHVFTKIPCYLHILLPTMGIRQKKQSNTKFHSKRK